MLELLSRLQAFSTCLVEAHRGALLLLLASLLLPMDIVPGATRIKLLVIILIMLIHLRWNGLKAFIIEATRSVAGS